MPGRVCSNGKFFHIWAIFYSKTVEFTAKVDFELE
jgi:hypothetical protein